MRKIVLIVTFLTLVVIACTRPEATQQAPQPSAGLTVKTVDGHTGNAVGGATVWLRLSEAPQSTRRQFRTNDSSGVAFIADLPIGRYAVRAQHLGFIFKDTVIKVDKLPLQPVVMRLERDTLTLR